MKKLNITRKQYSESKYFQKKYGKLEYVSESGKVYKTNKGQLIKFVNESYNDIDNDPAYECPNCGSHNCEFETVDEGPEEGYFDGSKMSAEFYCLDCNTIYDVDFKLKFDGSKVRRTR